MCFNEKNNSNNIQLFYNYGFSTKLLDSNQSSLGLSNQKISEENNFLICSFKRKKFIDFKDYFDLNQPYYLLIAQGKTELEGMEKLKIL